MLTTPSIISQDFAFASGRTGVLQQLLLTQSDVDRLLGAHDKKEVERIFTELKMTNPIDQGLQTAEEILPAIGKWIRREIEQMAPKAKGPVFHILWLNEDAQILSYLLKKHHNLTSAIASEPTSGMTAYDPQDLHALVEGADAGMQAAHRLPAHLQLFVAEIKQRSISDPKEIDTHVAQFITDLQLRLARAGGGKLVKEYVVHCIDLKNIKTALRLKDEDSDANQLLTGGDLHPSDLRGNADAIATTVAKTHFFHLADAIKQSADNPNALEQALAHVTARDIANMWNEPLSINQLFAFSALAEAQLRLLRVLVIGKDNGLSPQEIKAVLPPFLSASHYVL